MTPRELVALTNLRRRGQAPDLAVFVTDDWSWAARLGDDLGILAIRVRNADDHAHDWSALAGLWVVLSVRGSAAKVADFALSMLRVRLGRLDTFDGKRMTRVLQ